MNHSLATLASPAPRLTQAHLRHSPAEAGRNGVTRSESVAVVAATDVNAGRGGSMCLGLELQAILRKRPPKLPVIFMTAFPGEEIEERARAAAATASWSSPSSRMT